MLNSVLQLDPNEIIKFKIKRHPIGAVPIYLIGSFIFALVLSLSFMLARFEDQVAQYADPVLGYGLIGGLAVFSIIIALISTKLYFDNELVLTNESIVQILRPSLFSRKVSQLSLAKVQDVTVRQQGLFPTLFRYGEIEIETAGEESNFVFSYVGNHFVISKQIMEAGEEYVRQHEANGGAAYQNYTRTNQV